MPYLQVFMLYVFAPFALLAGICLTIKTIYLLAKGVRTKGTVYYLRLEMENPTYSGPYLRYTAKEKVIDLKLRTWIGKEEELEWEDGSAIIVRYHPAYPKLYVIDSFKHLYLPPLILLFLGGGILFTALHH